jgi:hypothetical protein
LATYVAEIIHLVCLYEEITSVKLLNFSKVYLPQVLQKYHRILSAVCFLSISQSNHLTIEVAKKERKCV